MKKRFKILYVSLSLSVKRQHLTFKFWAESTYHGICMTPSGYSDVDGHAWTSQRWLFCLSRLVVVLKKRLEERRTRLSFLISLPRHLELSNKSKQTNYRKQAEIWEIQLFSSLSLSVAVSRDKQNLFICCCVLVFPCSSLLEFGWESERVGQT